jgi:hypothetical protein
MTPRWCSQPRLPQLGLGLLVSRGHPVRVRAGFRSRSRSSNCPTAHCTLSRRRACGLRVVTEREVLSVPLRENFCEIGQPRVRGEDLAPKASVPEPDSFPAASLDAFAAPTPDTVRRGTPGCQLRGLRQGEEVPLVGKSLCGDEFGGVGVAGRPATARIGHEINLQRWGRCSCDDGAHPLMEICRVTRFFYEGHDSAHIGVRNRVFAAQSRSATCCLP